MCSPSQGFYGSSNALSSTAQTILDAWSADTGGVHLLGDPERLAAALRAVNEYVVLPRYQFTDWQMADLIRNDIEAIAAELENLND